jgi:Spx/MgsR family transcriptional regulator
MKLYGITNCNTVKKARAWMAHHGIACEFHDFKKSGVTQADLERWFSVFGWETVLNRAGLTWKLAPEPVRVKVRDAASATRFLMEKTSAIKRPVLEKDGKPVAIGFDEAHYKLVTGGRTK